MLIDTNALFRFKIDELRQKVKIIAQDQYDMNVSEKSLFDNDLFLLSEGFSTNIFLGTNNNKIDLLALALLI